MVRVKGDPENLPHVGLTPESVEYLGKRLNKASFDELRARNPAAVTVVHFYELPRDQELLDMAVLFPGGIIASDAMPWISSRTGREADPNAWPIPEDAFSHPRSAGTFTRFLAQYVRERRLISLSDAIAMTSYLPARLMEETAPQMKTKGPASARDGRGHRRVRSGNGPGSSNVRSAESNQRRDEVCARQRRVRDPERRARYHYLSRAAHPTLGFALTGGHDAKPK